MSSGAVSVGTGVASEPVVAAQAPGFFRRLLRRPLAVICIVFLLCVIGIAILAPIVMPEVVHEGVGDLLRPNQGPSRQNLLGTDFAGRDVLNRLLVGTRVEIIASLTAVAVGMLTGVPLGLAAGYLGGRLDRFVSWLTDLSFSVAALIMILVIAAIFPQNLTAMMITFGLLGAPGTARVVRSAVLPVREELYVAAARVSGLTRPYIIGRHVLPRIAGLVIVQTSLAAAGTIGITAGLAFLGIINPTVASWGGMLQDGIRSIQQQPWLIWPPGIAIGSTVLAFTLLGDVVRDAGAEAWSPPVQTRRRRRPQRAREQREAHVDRSRALMSVEHLTVGFPSPVGLVPVVEDVSFEVGKGEAVGIVGESGCGKTITAMAIVGMLPGHGQIEAGSIYYDGQNLTTLPDRERRRRRGKEIALISQEPTASLTPTFRVGWQIAEAVRVHQGVSRRVAEQRTIELFRQVRLPEPELVARRYVHELSGGMAQRVAIARALAGEPRLLIADEPTTALDVTVQSEILDLLRELREERGMAILLITHDWGVIADLCDRAVVMYAGEVVEQAALTPMFRSPLHPYTEALLGSNPHHAPDSDRLPTIPGSVPAPGTWPQGCHFHPRCSYVTPECSKAPIPLERPVPDRETRCIHHERLAAS